MICKFFRLENDDRGLSRTQVTNKSLVFIQQNMEPIPLWFHYSKDRLLTKLWTKNLT